MQARIMTYTLFPPSLCTELEQEAEKGDMYTF